MNSMLLGNGPKANMKETRKYPYLLLPRYLPIVSKLFFRCSPRNLLPAELNNAKRNLPAVAAVAPINERYNGLSVGYAMQNDDRTIQLGGINIGATFMPNNTTKIPQYDQFSARSSMIVNTGN